MSKIITVFGATGKQGGSVVKAILGDASLSKQYKIRAVTRDLTKPAALELKSKGVELVTADLDSKESLYNAIKGSDSVFLVTNFWEKMDRNVELTQGKNVVDIVKELNLSQFIYSSLIHVTDVSKGKFTHVQHFDAKAEVEQYARTAGIPHVTFVLAGYFMSNFETMARKQDDGSYQLAYPVGDKALFPLVDAQSDLGKFVLPALHDPAKFNGKQLLAAADYYPLKRLSSEFEEVLPGKKFNIAQVSEEQYRSFLPPHAAQELVENHLLLEGPGYYGGASLKESHDAVAALGLKLTTWKDFVRANFA